MKYVFMDTNVVIDFLANRLPFSTDAAKLFDRSVSGEIKIFVAAVSHSNIYYILKRQGLTNSAILELLESLSEISEIIDVSSKVIRQSLKTDFNDYEDAVQYLCALSVNNISFIVTRNTKDFKKSSLPVLTPAEAIAWLKNTPY